jgi:ribosomal protein S8
MPERTEWYDLHPSQFRKSMNAYGNDLLKSLCLGAYAANVPGVAEDLGKKYDNDYYNMRQYVAAGLKSEDDAFKELRRKWDEYKVQFHDIIVGQAQGWIRANPDSVRSKLVEAARSIPGADHLFYEAPDQFEAAVAAGVQEAISSGSLCAGISVTTDSIRKALAAWYAAHPGSAIATAITAGVPVETFTKVPAGVKPEDMAQLISTAVTAAATGIQANIPANLLNAFMQLQPMLNMISSNIAAQSAAYMQQQQYIQQQMIVAQHLQQQYEMLRKQLEEQAKAQQQVQQESVVTDQERNKILEELLGSLGMNLPALSDITKMPDAILSASHKVEMMALGIKNPYLDMLKKLRDGELAALIVEKTDTGYKASPKGKALGDYVEHPIEVINERMKQHESTKLGDRFGISDYIGETTKGGFDALEQIFADLINTLTIGQVKWNKEEKAAELMIFPHPGPWEKGQGEALGYTAGFFALVSSAFVGTRLLDTLAKALSLGVLDTIGELWRDIMWATGLPWMSWAITGAKVKAAILNHLEAMENANFRSRYPHLAEIQEMWATNYTDEATARMLLAFQGVPPWMEDFYLVRSFKDIPESSIKKLLLRGKMTLDEAYDRLRLLKYSHSDALTIIQSWLEEEKEDRADDIVKVIEKRYKAGAIDRTDALNLLADALGDESRARAKLEIWDLELVDTREKTPSESWIEKWWRAGYISDDQALERLVQIGYDPEDAVLILKYWREHKK